MKKPHSFEMRLMDHEQQLADLRLKLMMVEGELGNLKLHQGASDIILGNLLLFLMSQGIDAKILLDDLDKQCQPQVDSTPTQRGLFQSVQAFLKVFRKKNPKRHLSLLQNLDYQNSNED